MVLFGWRAALFLLIALGCLVLLVIAALWVAALLALVGLLAVLNFVWLPRLALRLRVPRLVLDLATLLIVIAAGWWLGAVEGAAIGGIGWLIAIGLPRLVGARVARRLQEQRWRTSGTVIVANACEGCGRSTFGPGGLCAACQASRELPSPHSPSDA